MTDLSYLRPRLKPEEQTFIKLDYNNTEKERDIKEQLVGEHLKINNVFHLVLSHLFSKEIPR